MASNRIFLFGDSADAPIALSRQLILNSRNSKSTQLFIENAVEAVAQEVQSLPYPERKIMGTIHSIQDLQACYENKQDPFGIAQAVLLFVARIGELILFAEKDPSILSQGGDASSRLVALSISGSMLAAAAPAAASNVDELIELGTYLAVVSCRMGVHIKLRGIQIEADNGCWALSAAGEVVNQLPMILGQFHQEFGIPKYKQAYIGVHAASWVTVFGPPSVLRKLVASSALLQKSHVVMVPTIGPVHASHLTAPDFDYIMGDTKLLDKEIKSNYHLISGTTNRSIPGRNLRILVKQALKDIFQHSISPEKVFEAGISILDRNRETSLFVLGQTSYLPFLRRFMRKEKLKIDLKINNTLPVQIDVHARQEGIAIVGMSGRFPGSDSIEGMWESILERQEFHKKIPTDRFDVNSYMNQPKNAKNIITAPYGCFLDHPGHFDHKLFNYSPREAIQMDPAQRILLHTTYEALEDAGMTTNGSRATSAKRINTFIGLGGDDWREVHEALGVDILWPQGNQRAFTPGRLHHYFKWEGATFCVDSACGSSASAVGLAFQALINRECDTAIAGAANVIATPFWHSALSRGGFLSPTGGCKTFRDDADGYCRGEAVAVLVLKRLEDAERDNDNIISVIRGYARNHSAETTSLTHPHAKTQERLFRSILNSTNLEPQDIDYVEFHGTGTIAGDSVELESVSNVFAHPDTRQKPLLAGAIKANLGHSEATAGIVSLIKGALVLERKLIPAQPGIPSRLKQYPSIESGRILVPAFERPFSESITKEGSKRRVLVNNFDAAGGNSCFVLEEAPELPSKRLDPRGFHVITVSAHNSTSLEQNKNRLLQFLEQESSINIADCAYTTTARRTHHSLRAAYVGQSTKDIAIALRKDLDTMSHKPSKTDKKMSLVCLFSGQGGVYVGMAKELLRTSAIFQRIVAEIEAICESLGFPPITDLLAQPNLDVQSIGVIQQHLSIVALEIAITRFWDACGVKPDIVIGHSLGEYSALYAAGVLSVFDVLNLVGKRAQLIQAKCVAGTHAMLSVSGTETTITSLMSKKDFLDCEVACLNSAGMIVLSGERHSILTLECNLKEQGLKCQLLDIPYAMHSRQMDTILSDYQAVIDNMQFLKPKIRLISTLLGHAIIDASVFEGDYLVRQTREPVNFCSAIESCVKEGFAATSTYWLEIGPNNACLGLLRANINLESSHALASLRKNESNWKSITTCLANLYVAQQPIDWHTFHGDFIAHLSLIKLPKFAFDSKNFWITYTENHPPAHVNNPVTENDPEPKILSTCLHTCVDLSSDESAQSASFITSFSYSSPLQLIHGHKLSGASVCSAGVFIDMALSAAQHLITTTNSIRHSQTLIVYDLQIDHPIVFTADEETKVIQTDIKRQTDLGNGFFVTFGCKSAAASTIAHFAKCRVRYRDEKDFNIELDRVSLSVNARVTKLIDESAKGLADVFRGKVFYRLFENLMEYSDMFKGIDSATVNEDFTELTANVQFKSQDREKAQERFNLSPFWIDILGQTLGFLVNGNPNQVEDYVYVGTHVARLEFKATDVVPGAHYQIHAHIYHSEGTDCRGNAYILHEGRVVGFMEGMRMHKMHRKTLNQLLGTTKAYSTNNEQLKRSSEIAAKSSPDIKKSSNHDNSQKPNGQTTSLATTFLQILLAETGLQESEVEATAAFFDIGVDSIISISILAALKAETGYELSASFLTEHQTLDAALSALQTIENQNSALTDSDSSMSNNTNEYASKHTEPVTLPLFPRESNAVLMQSANTPTPASLFLLADGAGSAAAYLHLPKLADGVQVIALESPWAKDPESFTSTFSEAAAIYLRAVRAKQPHGPYLLGGWSGGGVFAYEVSRRLLEAGERILGLIIIDIPAPQHFDRSKVSTPTFELIEEMGMLVGIQRTLSDNSPLSLRLKDHMLATVKCFSRLEPVPMTPGRIPDATFVVWATELIGAQVKNASVNKSNGHDLNAWFYPFERDSGPNGWDVLIGDSVECLQTPGDHFSIMTMPQVKHLGGILRELVARCIGS